MTNDSGSIEEILERVERTYSELIELIGTLDEAIIVERSSENEWSVQDLLAHVAAWEEILLNFHLSGKRFEDVVDMRGAEYRVTPFDEINKHIFERHRKWTFEEVSQYAERTHRELLDRLSQITENELRAPPSALVAMGIEVDSLVSYIAGNTYEHYLEHLDTVRRISDRSG